MAHIKNFLMRTQLDQPDVLKRKMRIKIPDSLPRAIDPEDIKKLLSVIRDKRDRALILVLLRSGMRIGELLSLTLEDLQLKEKRIEMGTKLGTKLIDKTDSVSRLC